MIDGMKETDPLAGFDGLSLYLEKLLDEWVQARKQQELEWLEDYQDAMAIPRDDDTRGTGAPRANKSKQLFIGSTRSKIRTAKARIRDTLFGAGKLPFDTTPNKEELRDFADAFETIVEGQLLDMEYKATLTAGINSISTYGTGWTFGPFVRKATIPDFTVDNSIPGMPQISKTDFEYDEPYYQHGRTMDVWPDPEANTEQTGRGVFWVEPTSSSDLEEWKQDSNYRNVDAALLEYSRYVQDSGSYLAEQARGNVERFSKDGRVNLVRFFGKVPERLLSEWENGETKPPEDDEESHKQVDVVVIMAGGIVVNAKKSPYRKYRPTRRCVYEEAVEPEMYGVGIARNNRPHQRVTNGAFRLYMEGKGMALLGMFNVDRSKFKPTENFKLYPGKVFERAEGITPEEAEKAMIQYKMDDVTAGWERVIELSEKFSDDDTGISKYTQGQDSSNLNKTATGVSMIMNASSVPLKDVMANIDSMWIEHHINDLIEWDLEFLDPAVVEKIHGPEIAAKWDAIKKLGTASFMNWRPTGQSTFVSREILAQKLQGFLQIIGSNERFQAETDTRELLEQIWDAMDIGKESPILSDEDLEKKGGKQIPPEIQDQMIKAKEEFDKLAQAHQEMQKQNDQLQMQLKSKDQEIQVKSAAIIQKTQADANKLQIEMQQRTQEFMLSLAAEERQSQREEMLKKYMLDMTEANKVAIAEMNAASAEQRALMAEDTKRYIAELQKTATESAENDNTQQVMETMTKAIEAMMSKKEEKSSSKTIEITRTKNGLRGTVTE